MSEIASHRRYLLLKALVAANTGDEVLSLAWRTRQTEVSGTSLPATFPHRATLVAEWYETVEDVRGADAAELHKYAGLSSKDAATVVAAIALI